MFLINKKTFTLSLSVILAYMSVIMDFAYAQKMTVDLAKPIGIKQPMLLISSSLGRISERNDFFSRSKAPLVILIQDIHINGYIQKKEFEIIKELRQKYKIKKIYVEGGYGNINTSWISGNKKLADALVNDGYLTGAEYYSIKTSEYNILKGLENKEIHQSNIMRLSQILNKQSEYKKIIKVLDKEISAICNSFLSKPLRKFNRIISKYKLRRVRDKEYFNFLVKYAKKHSIQLSDYPNIIKYLSLLNLKKINYQKASKELSKINDKLKNELPYIKYKKLLDCTDKLSDIKALSHFFIARSYTEDNLQKMDFEIKMEDDVSSHSFIRIPIESMPNLAVLLWYAHLSDSINFFSLIEEEKKLVRVLRFIISENKKEYEISFLSDFYTVFKDYLTANLQRTDYAYFKENFFEFMCIWKHYITSGIIEKFNKEYKLLDEYYKTNLARDTIFVNSIMSDFSHSDDSEAIIVISGGFHSSGLVDVLNGYEISNITITPSSQNVLESEKFIRTLF